MKKEKDW